MRIKIGRDFTVFYSIFDIRLDPIFNAVGNAWPAVHERDTGAGPVELECRNRRRVLGAHDDNVVIVIGMRLLVVMDDLGESLTGDVQEVGYVVVAAGDDDLARGCNEYNVVIREELR